MPPTAGPSRPSAARRAVWLLAGVFVAVASACWLFASGVWGSAETGFPPSLRNAMSFIVAFGVFALGLVRTHIRDAVDDVRARADPEATVEAAGDPSAIVRAREQYDPLLARSSTALSHMASMNIVGYVRTVRAAAHAVDDSSHAPTLADRIRAHSRHAYDDGARVTAHPDEAQARWAAEQPAAFAAFQAAASFELAGWGVAVTVTLLAVIGSVYAGWVPTFLTGWTPPDPDWFAVAALTLVSFSYPALVHYMRRATMHACAAALNRKDLHGAFRMPERLLWTGQVSPGQLPGTPARTALGRVPLHLRDELWARRIRGLAHLRDGWATVHEVTPDPRHGDGAPVAHLQYADALLAVRDDEPDPVVLAAHLGLQEHWTAVRQIGLARKPVTKPADGLPRDPVTEPADGASVEVLETRLVRALFALDPDLRSAVVKRVGDGVPWLLSPQQWDRVTRRIGLLDPSRTCPLGENADTTR